MKTALITVVDCVLLLLAALVAFAAGLFVPALRLTHEVSRNASTVRTFDLGWVVAVVLVAVMILAVALWRKWRLGWLPPVLALVIVLAVLLLFTRLGYRDTPLLEYML